MSKKSSKSNKAFLEKIKTITIGTGVQGNCPACGDPLQEHEVAMVPVVIPVLIPKSKKQKEKAEPKTASKDVESRSFAA